MKLALLRICCFISEALPISLTQILPPDRYCITTYPLQEIFTFPQQAYDCLIFWGDTLPLHTYRIPIVQVATRACRSETTDFPLVFLSIEHWSELPESIDHALRHAQGRKNSQQYFLDTLAQRYRILVLDYFKHPPDRVERSVEEFSRGVFQSHLSAAQVLKMHMHLMEELTQQLKLEGRNTEILLDYRITLIDVISHLCERYRMACASAENLPSHASHQDQQTSAPAVK